MALRFEELIGRHHDEIFAYLWRLLGKERHGDGATDVEDLVQEVFLRAYQAFAGLRPQSNHRAWLYKIATNCAYGKLGRVKVQREKFSALRHPAMAFAPASDSSVMRESMERKLRALVNELPYKQKVCVTMRYLQDLDYAEIARILGCSRDSVRANVHQAIRRLRVALKEEIR
jgi:RNA polymerase sigma-70 factor (ECF subfamily)